MRKPSHGVPCPLCKLMLSASLAKEEAKLLVHEQMFPSVLESGRKDGLRIISSNWVMIFGKRRIKRPTSFIILGQ